MFRDHLTMGGMRRLHRLIDMQHGACWQARAQQGVAQRVAVLARQSFIQQRVQRGAVLDAQRIRGEARIGDEVLDPEEFAEFPPRRLVAAGDEDLAGAGGEFRIGADVRMRVAERLRPLAVQEEIRRLRM